jgi:MFS family permease
MSTQELTAEQIQAYQERIRQNYVRNFPYGIAQGILFFAGMGFYHYSTIFTNFIYDLSNSDWIVGFMLSAMHIGFTSSQIFGSALVEHLRQKKPALMLFGLIFRLSWLLIGIAAVTLPARAALYASIGLFFVGQLFNGIYILIFFDMMAKVIPQEKRGPYFGLRNSISLFAQAGCSFLAGTMVNRFSYAGGDTYMVPLGYALCFILAFAAHLLDLGALRMIKEEPSPVVGQKTSVWKKITGIPAFLRADRNYAMYCVVRSFLQTGFMISPFVIGYARQQLTFTGTTLGTFTSVNLLSWSLGMYLWGRISTRMGFKRIMELSTIMLASAYFLSPFVNNYSLFFVFFMVSGFIAGGQMLSFDNLLMEFGRPDNRPTYIAVSTLISGIAGASVPVLAGYLADSFSYVTLFYVFGAVMLAASIAMNRKVVDPRKVSDYWS